MNKHILFYLFIVSLLITSLVITSGCGKTNFFKSMGFAPESSQTITESAKKALDNGDYATAKAEAEKVLAVNPNDETAKVVKAEAQLGEVGFAAATIASNLAISVTNETDLNALDAVVGNVDLTVLKNSADLLNSTSAVTTDASVKLTASTSSAVYGAKTISNKFDYDGDGSLTEDEMKTKTPEQLSQDWSSVSDAAQYLNNGSAGIVSVTNDNTMKQNATDIQDIITKINAANTDGSLTSQELKDAGLFAK